VFLLLWGGLVAWRWEWVDSPPYWDYIGFFREAIYLADTHFDYDALLHEKSVFEGGPRTYVTSIVPPALAAIMLATPTVRAALIVSHLICMGLAAAVVVIVAILVRREFGWPLALLVAAGTLTTPLFSTQVDMITMELPLVLCGLLCAAAVFRERYILAAIASTAAYFVKATGTLFVLATLVVLVLQILLHWGRPAAERQRMRVYVVGLIANLLALAIQLGAMQWAGMMVLNMPDETVVNPDIPDPADYFSVLMALYWCPDILLLTAALLLVASLLWGRVIWQALRRNGGNSTQGNWWLRLQRGLSAEYAARPALFYGLVITLGAFAAATRLVFVPRYVVVTIPFLYLALASLGTLGPRVRVALCGLLLAVVALNLINENGRFFPSIADALEPDFDRMGCFLERSREYRDDHRANLAVLRLIEEQWSDADLVCGAPFATCLTQPRLGYVTSPIACYASDTLAEELTPPASRLLLDRPEDPVFLYSPRPLHLNSILNIPPPEETDEVLFSDNLAPPMLLYRKRNAEGIRPTADELVDWLLPHIYEGYLPNWRTGMVIEILRESQLPDRIGPFLQDVVECFPQNADAHAAYGQHLLEQGKQGEVLAQIEKALQLDPQCVNALLLRASLQLTNKNPTAAQTDLQQALKVAPTRAKVHDLLARCYEAEGRLSDAIQSLQTSLKLQPDNAEALDQLAGIYLRQGRQADAKDLYQQAIAAKPNYVDARLHLAQLLAHEQQLPAAAEQLQLALESNPKHVDSLVTYGALLSFQGQYRQAADCYQRALREKPERLEIRADLALNLQQAGDIEEAVRRYRQILKVQPNWVAGANNLAWILATDPDDKLRDGAESYALAEAVCQAEAFGDPGHLDTLAAACAERGDFDNAAKWARQAIELCQQKAAKDPRQSEVAQQIEQRLQLYLQGQAFRATRPKSSPATPPGSDAT
jgi:tetratricopeptide (TPR) repeat protein